MGLRRLVTMLLASGFALVVAGIALSLLPAYAATERDRTAPNSLRYTDHPSRASTSSGRTVPLYIDRDFDDSEVQRILSAVRQWNHVLNGFVEFRAGPLPNNASSQTISQIRRSGGWIVAKVDSRHPITREGEGRQALAVTVGNRGGGFVYVISDRIGGRDLTGVVMHEFGHVLGAGHDQAGLMAPVYNAAAARCIDRDAAAMIASAQHLPLSQLNWCDPYGADPGYARRSAASMR